MAVFPPFGIQSGTPGPAIFLNVSVCYRGNVTKITQKVFEIPSQKRNRYEFTQLFESAEMFQFFLGR